MNIKLHGDYDMIQIHRLFKKFVALEDVKEFHGKKYFLTGGHPVSNRMLFLLSEYGDSEGVKYIARIDIKIRKKK